MNIEKLEQLRIKKYIKYKIILTLAIILFSATILYFLFMAISHSMDFIKPFIYVIMFMTSSLLFYLAKKTSKNFANAVKEVLIDDILVLKFDDFEFDVKSHISKKVINEVGIFRKPSRISGEDHLKGRYQNVSFEVSDLKLERSDGDSTYTFFEGRWFIFKFNKNFNETIKLIEGSKIGITINGLSEEETESTVFNKKYRMYSSNKNFFYKFMTPLMIDKIMNFYEGTKGKVSFALINNELHIAIYDKTDFLKIDLKNPLSNKVIDDFKLELNQIIEIIEKLDLNTDKFN